MQKKSQIQMMETISILFIFFILVGVGITFYSKIMSRQVRLDLEKFQELSKIQIAQIASSLPELQCSQDNIIKSNCIDKYKLIQAEPIISANIDDYFDLFAYSNIIIEEVFPAQNSLTLYTKEPPKWSSKLPTYFPISIYNPEDQNYYFGVIIVEVFI